MRHVSPFPFPVRAVLAAPLAAQQSLPPLPDTTGFGVHVLAIARAPDQSVWVGTYGQGIFVLRQGAGSWEQLKHSSDTTARSISFDFVHAFGFGPGGEIWYGTVGNGWGLSTDGGKTWTNWELKQLGPAWQYVAPDGIVTRGDTVYVGTADGIKLSWDRGRPGRPRGERRSCRATAGAGTGPRGAGPGVRGHARRRVRGGRRRAQRLRHDAERQRAVAARARGLRRRETHRPGDLPHRSAVDPGGRHLPGATRHGLTRHSTHVVRTAHRAHRPAVHRPDVPLRLDDGRGFPGASRRRVQQPRRDAGADDRRRRGRVRGAGGARGEHGRHPPRPKAQRSFRLFDVLPQRAAPRVGGPARQGGRRDRAGRQHGPRDQRPPAS